MYIFKKKFVLFFILTCNLLVFPASSYDNEPYAVDAVTSFFSPDLLLGQNYTWVVQEWDQMEEWLNPNTEYEPKSGDTWTMTIVGDLTQLTPVIIALELFGVYYDPQSLLQLSDYLQFNISGYTFEEVFGSSVGEDLNWVMLSKFFLIPLSIKDGNGSFRNFSTYYDIYLEAYHPDAESNTDNGVLALTATLPDGSYTANLGVEFDGKLGLQNNFTYQKESAVSGLITGKVQVQVKESEFITTNQTDETTDDTLNDSNPIDSPFEIPGYPSLMFWTFTGIIFLFKVKEKKIFT